MKLYDNDSFRETFMNRVYELLADDPDNYRANEIIDLFDNAPEFNPPNEPLTPDQLRGMYGEPVWVTSARERGNIPSRWVLFAGVSKSKRNSDVFVFATTGGIAQGYEAVNYGKTWNAYRRPLGGEEDQHGNHRL